SSTDTTGFEVMFKLYHLVSLILAFSFFPSVRHGLRLIFNPAPPFHLALSSPASTPIIFLFFQMNPIPSDTFPSLNQIALRTSVSTIQSDSPPPYSNLSSVHNHESDTDCPSCAPPSYNHPTTINHSVF
ncbi:hypothetical protein PENTCL1PPCAC_25883, partial [Pristionchus entomophagus]